MKNAEKIFNIGQLIMILGSVLYLAELLRYESDVLTLIIAVIYVVALVLMGIGWIGTRDQRKALKEQQKREAAQAKANKAA